MRFTRKEIEERDRQTERQIKRQTNMQADRQMVRETEREGRRRRDKERRREGQGQRDKQTGKYNMSLPSFVNDGREKVKRERRN